jgi:hypothetical protein
MERFDITTLPELFSNIKANESDAILVRFSVYGVGGYKGDISYFKETPSDIRIYIDNYPGQKKFYATNIPFESKAEFVSKIKYLGLDLMPIEQSPITSEIGETEGETHICQTCKDPDKLALLYFDRYICASCFNEFQVWLANGKEGEK